jgi:flagellar hook protein FlgE
VHQDFVRDSDGVITTINLPGTAPNCVANAIQGLYSVPFPSVSVNDQGTITGYYTNAAKVPVAFVRFENGKVITFYRRGSKQTIPTAINTDGVIIGYFSQGREVVGFIREP